MVQRNILGAVKTFPRLPSYANNTCNMSSYSTTPSSPPDATPVSPANKIFRRSRGCISVLEDASVTKGYVSRKIPLFSEQYGDAYFQAIANVYNNKNKPRNRENSALEAIKNGSKLINKT